MNAKPPAARWPVEFRLNPAKTGLTVTFGDGVSQTLCAELLRVKSPSAEVQGHSPSGRKLLPGKRNVTIVKIDPIGNYAIRIDFSDGHNTGLYTWNYLYELAEGHARLLDGYIEELSDAGLSRDL